MKFNRSKTRQKKIARTLEEIPYHINKKEEEEEEEGKNKTKKIVQGFVCRLFTSTSFFLHCKAISVSVSLCRSALQMHGDSANDQRVLLFWRRRALGLGFGLEF